MSCSLQYLEATTAALVLLIAFAVVMFAVIVTLQARWMLWWFETKRLTDRI